MRIAVPVWNGRVSPVLDTAKTLRIVTVAEGRIAGHEDVPMESPLVSARADQVRRLAVDVLICGALSRPLGMMIESAGARVLPWISGDVDDVVSAWIEGNLSSDRFSAPGFRGRRLRRRQRGGRGRR